MKTKIALINIMLIFTISLFLSLPLQAQQAYTISGQIMDQGGRTGINDVSIAFSSAAGTDYVTTSGDGNYSYTVPMGWTGTVTPLHSCYTFDPASINVGPVNANLTYSFTAFAQDITISGTVSDGAPVYAGVILTNALEGVTVILSNGTRTVTGPSGTFSFTVPCGWTGGISAIKTGWNFTPPSFSFTDPLSDDELLTFIGTSSTILYSISGQVTADDGRTGMDNVTITFYDGSTVHEETTSGGGYYWYDVPLNWTGSVTPSLAGYSFMPVSANVGPVTSPVVQNFTASGVTLTVSGTVMDDKSNPIQGVNLAISGGGTAVTDINGNYSFEVSYGWSGTVTPSLAGWVFEPVMRTYSNLVSDRTSEYYIGYKSKKRVGISGAVRQADGTGIAGVSLAFSGGQGTAITDDVGNYSKLVPFNWSGTVTPSLAGYSFSPASRTYTSLKTDQTDQDYTDFSGTGPGAPLILLSPNRLNFGVDGAGNASGPQSFLVDNSGGGTLNWTLSADQPWISYNPTSGVNSGYVTVYVDASGLAPGTYSGTITVSSPDAANSPQTLEVTLNVYETTEPPFGDFATPQSGSKVCSSVPFTGWALDDIGVQSVKIYLKDKGSFIYIGDAVFVEGARPDVELLYPGYPMSNRAGWGYMMLTYFLPNGGNGAYTFHAIATDVEGNETTLGIHTVICDNDNAVKPFGAIDSPAQGGTASGDNFFNRGWVLTPPPNSIPVDGSTIDVWVDGVKLGHPVYNIYREDIATLFPGYANSSGAGAYFELDTTAYENGVHTIYWTATDDAGNTDGIGSRFFTISNTGNNANRAAAVSAWTAVVEPNAVPIDEPSPIMLKKGFKSPGFQPLLPDENGNIIIEAAEMEPIEINLGCAAWRGYLVVGDQLRSLPIGSTLKQGNFQWLPLAGFNGEYRLLFTGRKPNGDIYRKTLTIKIN